MKDGKLRGSQVARRERELFAGVQRARSRIMNLLQPPGRGGRGQSARSAETGRQSVSARPEEEHFNRATFGNGCSSLRCACFVLDVGVRRVQIDREEWLKATANLRRMIFFWRGKTRPVEADESLAALAGATGPCAHNADCEARGAIAGVIPAGKTGERFGECERNKGGDHKRGGEAGGAEGATRDCDEPPPRCKKEGAARA